MESRTYERNGATITIADEINKDNMLFRVAYVWGKEMIMPPLIVLLRVNLNDGHSNIQATRFSREIVYGGGDLAWTVPDQTLAQLLYDIGIFDLDGNDLPDDLAQQLRDLL